MAPQEEPSAEKYSIEKRKDQSPMPHAPARVDFPALVWSIHHYFVLVVPG